MMIDDKEDKARQVVQRLFRKFPGTGMTRDEALKIISLNTFQNSSGPMQKYGFVEYERAEGKGRKIVYIRLTEKGEAAVAAGTNSAKKEVIDPVTNLNALGEFMDKFNSRNRYWELKLVPRGEPIERRR